MCQTIAYNIKRLMNSHFTQLMDSQITIFSRGLPNAKFPFSIYSKQTSDFVSCLWPRKDGN